MKSVLMIFASIGIASSAQANSPPPVDYRAEIDGNTVTVCANDYVDSRDCPDADGMLRENIDTGEVVRLADACDAEGCYVDECVDAGRYRYGFANPLECNSSGAAFFEFVEIDTDATGCTRSGDAPAAYDLGLPWQDEAWMSCNRLGGCTGLGGHASALALQVAVFVGAGLFLLRRGRKER